MLYMCIKTEAQNGESSCNTHILLIEIKYLKVGCRFIYTRDQAAQINHLKLKA